VLLFCYTFFSFMIPNSSHCSKTEHRYHQPKRLNLPKFTLHLIDDLNLCFAMILVIHQLNFPKLVRELATEVE